MIVARSRPIFVKALWCGIPGLEQIDLRHLLVNTNMHYSIYGLRNMLLIFFISVLIRSIASRVPLADQALMLEQATAASADCGALGRPCCPPDPQEPGKPWICRDASTCIYFQLGGE